MVFYVLTYHLGKGVPNVGSMEVTILTAGQTIVVFFIVIVFFGSAIVVFMCEMIHKSFKNRKKLKIENGMKKFKMNQYLGSDL